MLFCAEQEEAPLNRMLRLEGNEGYQNDDTWVGGGGGSGGNHRGGGGGGGNSGGGGFWREDDPYWPLRDWGDHPMRWWTLAFAALMAVGGVLGHATHGSVESLFVGGAAAAALASCSAAMSDMTDWGHGPLAVKVAWAICALLAIKVGDLSWLGVGGRCDTCWVLTLICGSLGVVLGESRISYPEGFLPLRWHHKPFPCDRASQVTRGLTTGICPPPS